MNIQPIPLKPFRYPKFIKVMMIGILALFIYACHLTFACVPYVRYKKEGESLKRRKEYKYAIVYFERVLHRYPYNQNIKISLAICHFGLHTLKNNQIALSYLEGIDIDKDTWEALTAVMPKEYQAYFE